MSKTLEEFVEVLDAKAKGSIQGTATIVVDEDTFILLTEDGAHISDGTTEVDVTLSASREVFEDIMAGDQNPTMAFMSGKLKVDGSSTRALKVSEILTQ